MVVGTEDDLARDFGFDISMPDGNVGLPSAAHKLFMEQCKVLYREFMANMAVHIKTEKQLKKALRSLHEEKLRNLRFSLYRSESADPFVRKQDVESSTTALLESRVNTPWGLDIIPDEDGQGGPRPQTAPAGALACRKGVIHADTRPKTAGVSNSPFTPDGDDNDSESGLSEMSAATKSTIMGVVDRKTEQRSNRKITVGQRSFTKITHGNVTAKFKHKDGKFVVKPVKVDMDREAAASDTLAYDPTAAKQKFDPVTERLALVRKITNFKTPTISSDMKINNRVPIQKCLRGLDAKRTTISEIYQSARDRRARHFRIVTYKPGKAAAQHDEREINSRLMVRPELSNKWARALRTSFSVGVGRGQGHAMDNQEADDKGESGSRSSRPRSILLLSGSNASKSLGESFSAKELADSAFLSVYQDISKRPNSRVAFARADSVLSNDNVFINEDSVDVVASVNNVQDQSDNTATNFFQISKKNPLMSAMARTRNGTQSGNSEPELSRSRSGSSRVPSDQSAQTADRFASAGSPKEAQKHLLSVNGGHVNGERPSSVSSTGTSAQRPNQSSKQQPENGGSKKPKPLERTTSSDFKAPSKLDSRRDTVKIVKQQMRMDKALDERMAVWRRRMAVKSTAMTTKLRPSPRRSKIM